MPMIDLTVRHGRDLDGAKADLARAVADVERQFGPMIRRVEWATDRASVRIEGIGFWAEMRVDDRDVHATGDMPALGRLLGSPIGRGLTRIVRDRFAKGLPGGKAR